MKRFSLILLMLASANLYAFDDDAYRTWSTKKNYTQKSEITWIPVDNVQVTCEQETVRRGFKAIMYGVNACSFWDYKKNGDPVCTIYTNKETSMWTLGHEVRHCFQGPWH